MVEIITEVRQEAEALVTKALEQSGNVQDYIDLVPSIVDLFEVATPPVPGRRELRVRTWAIRSQDFDLIKAALDASKAAAASSFFSSGALTPSLVGTVVVVHQALRTAWTKGARLSSPEIRLIIELRVAGPATDLEIAAWHANGGPVDSEAVAELAQRLQALTQVRLRDGSIAPLVAKDGAGRWAPLI